MERRYYLIESHRWDQLERVWAWCSSTPCEHVLMYKTRLNASTTGWIVDCPDDGYLSIFLIHFSNLVTEIARPNYYDTYLKARP